MKRIFVGLFLIIIIIAGFSIFALNQGNIKRTCKLADSGISIKIPYIYKYVENENNLISLYNSQNGISIDCVKVEENFWSSTELEKRMEEYIKVISAANYDAEIKNVKSEVIEIDNKSIGKILLELNKENMSQKTITVIIGDVVIEITGGKEAIDANMSKIDEMIKTIRNN